MGLPEQKIALGADWAWFLPPKIDRGWAGEWLTKCGAEEGRVNIGVNLVNEGRRRVEVVAFEAPPRKAADSGSQQSFAAQGGAHSQTKKSNLGRPEAPEAGSH
jgi:hypothetical protein